MTAITIYASARPSVTARMANNGDSGALTALARRAGVSWLTNKRLIKGVGDLAGPGHVPGILRRWANTLKTQGLVDASADVVALVDNGIYAAQGPCLFEMRDLFTLMSHLDCDPVDVWRLWEVKRCFSALSRYDVQHPQTGESWEAVAPEEEDARAVVAVEVFKRHGVLPMGSQLKIRHVRAYGVALVRPSGHLADTWVE